MCVGSPRLLTVLEVLSGLVIIDEVQRQPELFELLRVLVDRPHNSAHFLLLGSASPHLVRGASESLAGRIGFVDLAGFDLTEVDMLGVIGCGCAADFPGRFWPTMTLTVWPGAKDFIRTFLERDIPQLGITIPAETLRRFWMMVAHYHGQVWTQPSSPVRWAHPKRPCGATWTSSPALTWSVCFALVQNVSKRQVKSPKIYIRDSGILHGLLQLASSELQSHPKLGASWEGFAVEQIIRSTNTRDAYFWATHAGAELDLLVLAGGKRYGFEIKYADAPGTSRSMQVAQHDLALEHLWVVYPGQHAYVRRADHRPAAGCAPQPEVTPSLNITTGTRGMVIWHSPCPPCLRGEFAPLSPSADRSARRRSSHVAACRSPERAVQLLPAWDWHHVGGDALKKNHGDTEGTENR